MGFLKRTKSNLSTQRCGDVFITQNDELLLFIGRRLGGETAVWRKEKGVRYISSFTFATTYGRIVKREDDEILNIDLRLEERGFKKKDFDGTNTPMFRDNRPWDELAAYLSEPEVMERITREITKYEKDLNKLRSLGPIAK